MARQESSRFSKKIGAPTHTGLTFSFIFSLFWEVSLLLANLFRIPSDRYLFLVRPIGGKTKLLGRQSLTLANRIAGPAIQDGQLLGGSSLLADRFTRLSFLTFLQFGFHILFLANEKRE